MGEYQSDDRIVRLQQVLTGIILAAVAAAAAVSFWSDTWGARLDFFSLLLLILAAPVRLIALARYFKHQNNSRYALLSYMVIVVMALSVVFHYLT